MARSRGRCESIALSAAKLRQSASNGPRSMNTIIGPPVQNSTEKSISLEQPQWTIPTCRCRRRRRRLVLLLLFSCSAAPGPAVRVPREWLLACGEGSEFAKIWGPAQPRPRSLDGAMRRVCLAGFRKQQARLLSLSLTGHIRDLACSLFITIRAGDITAISCQPVKTARRFPWPKGLCEERRFIKYPIG